MSTTTRSHHFHPQNFSEVCGTCGCTISSCVNCGVERCGFFDGSRECPDFEVQECTCGECD